MKVIAINSSPNKGKGTTAMILGPFLEGLKEEGAEVELFFTKDLDIKSCMADFQCWVKKPGICIYEDDMKMLVPKISSADLWVIATPVYVDGMTGQMKNLMDRMVPSILPFFELRDGHCRHPVRPLDDGNEPGMDRKIVLVSTCGFWEMDNFDPLVTHVKAICKNTGHTYAGALLRPHAPAFQPYFNTQFPIEKIFDAAKEAGKQFAVNGEFSDETLSKISEPLLSIETFVETINKGFQFVMEQFEKPAQPV